MTQSRVMSLVEVVTSSLIGLVVSVFANFLPIFFDLHPSLTASFWITVMFMVLSIIRGYLVRRFFATCVTRCCQELYDHLANMNTGRDEKRRAGRLLSTASRRGARG